MAQRAAHPDLVLGTIQQSIWCNACMTSGGFQIPVLRLSQFGVSQLAIGFGCTTCEGPGDLEPEQ